MNGRFRSGRSSGARQSTELLRQERRRARLEPNEVPASVFPEINEVTPMEDRTMKVVIFCGGMGLRLREYSENVPKPLVPIGEAPVVWHLMKYYSHYGHNDFILCLGHKSEPIRRFFLGYNEALSRDFVLTNGGHDVQLLGTDY